MAPRLELQQILESILGTRNVYFQPPPSLQMGYPAIVYKRDSLDTKYANDLPYAHTKRYLITVIDRNPDSAIPDKIRRLPMSSYDRFYTADGLNHDVFRLFF